ncbi:MAG: hypothetical protein CVT49_06930 [candidate division Zixibacteria bacterium HGW-Zixibacteria-1]|nr:MAG: hypothetical protein CVT49_06930 [candidate division Zixibacteria bacterium HGW-Zixibacteria-1]
MKISEVTRRNIFDALQNQKISWNGRLEELGFLTKLFDLEKLPSEDHRFKNAHEDIVQHRVSNHDWEDNWIFYDKRFNLLYGNDDDFLRFLCEIVNPIVRPDTDEVSSLVKIFNKYLGEDGWEIVEKTRISGAPVFSARRILVGTEYSLNNAMAEVPFPESTEVVISALTKYFQKQRKNNIVEILKAASAQIEQTDYDNWNGGIYLYTLYLHIPMELFAEVDLKLEEIQKTITQTAQSILRTAERDHISNVVVAPIIEPTSFISDHNEAEQKGKHLWEPGMLRLFISHVSAHRTAVSRLKQELHIYGISSFVAHEDIKPTVEWQLEIKKALCSMHALAALLTQDFHNSKWTDQEVGFALGRGFMIIPIRIDINPYGFLGAHQALPGNFNEIESLAPKIVNALVKNDSTGFQMREGLVVALEKSTSYLASIAIGRLISGIDSFTPEQIARMVAAHRRNSQVSGAFGVSEIIQDIAKQNKVDDEDDLPF